MLTEEESQTLEEFRDYSISLKQLATLVKLYFRKTGKKPKSPEDPEFLDWLKNL